MRWIGIAALSMCLACGGMMGVFIPDLPIRLPRQGVRVFHGKEEGGVTRVGGIIEGMDHEAICRHFTAQMQAGGWIVGRSGAEPRTILTGQRGTERLEVEISGPMPGASADFDVRWTP